MTMNVVEAVTRVQERIHDRLANTFDEAEVLRAVDDNVRRIFTMLRAHGEAEQLDNTDVAIATQITQLENGVFQYTLPDTISDVQFIEVLRGDGSMPYAIPHAPLEHKDAPRGVWKIPTSSLMWNWGPRGSIQVRGALDGWPTLRIWFVRLIPPLFRGVASSGSTTTSIVVASSTGAFKARDGLYVGSRFEGTGGGANAGQFRMCTAQTASTLTVDAFPGTMSSQPFAMLLPLQDAHCEYLIELVALNLMRRQASPKEAALINQAIGELQQGFEMGIARRQTGEPPRLFSSRQIR